MDVAKNGLLNFSLELVNISFFQTCSGFDGLAWNRQPGIMLHIYVKRVNEKQLKNAVGFLACAPSVFDMPNLYFVTTNNNHLGFLMTLLFVHTVSLTLN